MDFAEVRQRVFTAYAHGSYLEPVGLLRQARSQFPDRDDILTFWEACLSSMGGEPESALDALEAGLDRGLAWHPKMLADPDLDSARELAGWEDFEQRSAKLIAPLEEDRPEPVVRRSPDPVGTLVALHGGGDNPGDFFSQWEKAVPEEWTLITPVGDVPRSQGRWAWPYDLSTDSLADSLDDQPLHEPIVLAGFSQGAALALKAAWNGLFPVSGSLLVAGMLGVDQWLESRKHPVPLYLIVGTADDISYEPSRDTCAALEEAGVPVYVDVHEGLGHEYPPDLDQVIRDGLDWIKERSGRPASGTAS